MSAGKHLTDKSVLIGKYGGAQIYCFNPGDFAVEESADATKSAKMNVASPALSCSSCSTEPMPPPLHTSDATESMKMSRHISKQSSSSCSTEYTESDISTFSLEHSLGDQQETALKRFIQDLEESNNGVIRASTEQALWRRDDGTIGEQADDIEADDIEAEVVLPERIKERLPSVKPTGLSTRHLAEQINVYSKLRFGQRSTSLPDALASRLKKVPPIPEVPEALNDDDEDVAALMNEVPELLEDGVEEIRRPAAIKLHTPQLTPIMPITSPTGGAGRLLTSANGTVLRQARNARPRIVRRPTV